VLTAALFTIVWEKSAAALNHPQSDAAVFVVRIGEATNRQQERGDQD
jgi:hypothetical protein